MFYFKVGLAYDFLLDLTSAFQHVLTGLKTLVGEGLHASYTTKRMSAMYSTHVPEA